MVLQGDEEGFSPPFDSSIFGASYGPTTPGEDYVIEYDDCDAVSAFFTTSSDVRALLPEGIEPWSDPPQAGVLLARYPTTTVGTYNEEITVVQVEDPDGELAYYIPYIYVTNDAAMAAGRELAGAPKKIADIQLQRDEAVYQGTMERPAGKRLLTVTCQPEERASGGMIDQMLPSPVPLLSIRHLPPIEGGDGCTQLVEWYADIDYHTDEAGDVKRWMGPTTVTYDQHSASDPVDRVPADDVLFGMYAKFDMELGATAVRKEWEL